METDTDVSAAQSFDVGSFLNNIVNVGAGLAAQRLSTTQNNGQPSVTTTPNVRANPNGNTVVAGAGINTQTVAMLAVGAAVVIGALYLLRK